MAWIPPTTAETIVFPFKEELKTFSTDFYSPDMMDDQVSLQEINQFVSQIEAEFKLYEQRKTELEEQLKMDRESFEDQCCQIILNILLFYSSLFFFAFFPKIFPKLEALFPTFFCLIHLAIFKEQKRESSLSSYPSFETLFDQMKKKCQEIADEHNKILRNRGLKWSIPLQFPYWIELNKDMEKQNIEFELLTQLGVPSTTEYMIIFPIQRYKYFTDFEDFQNCGFSQDFYSPETTHGRISREEIQDFLSEVNAELQKPLKKEPKPQPKIKTNFLPFQLYISFVFLVLYLSSHFLHAFESLMGLIITFILFGPALKEVVDYEERKVCQDSDSEKRTLQIKARKARCQEIGEKYNETLQSRELRWHLPEEFPSWIELCKDYKTRREPIQLVEISGSKRKAQKRNYGQDEKYAPLLDDKV